ncbi:MAG: acyloxyacyl hydrolase [Pseudomonadota bacterium]
MKKSNHAFAVFVFVIVASVFPFNTVLAQMGGYMGVFGGYTLSQDASMSYYDYDYRYGDVYDFDAEETWVLGFKLGYTLPRFNIFSFEFEYSYLNPDVDRTIWTYADAGYAKIEGDTSIHNFMFNAIAKFPGGKIHPYIGTGLGFSYMDASVSTTSTAHSASNDDTVFAWQILVGIDLELTNNLSMDIGYRYFATESESESDYDYDYYHEDYSLDYEASMVTVGLTFRF